MFAPEIIDKLTPQRLVVRDQLLVEGETRLKSRIAQQTLAKTVDRVDCSLVEGLQRTLHAAHAEFCLRFNLLQQCRLVCLVGTAALERLPQAHQASANTLL